MDNVRWARPLRLHLSVVIVILLVAISVPLMWLTYQQGTRSAIAAGDQQMRLLSRHAIDRYRSIFSDGYSAIAMTSVSEALLKAPPADQQAKTDFLIKALSGSSYIDGIYVGYPTGDFVQAVNVARNPKWREALCRAGAHGHSLSHDREFWPGWPSLDMALSGHGWLDDHRTHQQGSHLRSPQPALVQCRSEWHEGDRRRALRHGDDQVARADAGNADVQGPRGRGGDGCAA